MKKTCILKQPCKHLVTSEVALLMTRCSSQIPSPPLRSVFLGQGERFLLVGKMSPALLAGPPAALPSLAVFVHSRQPVILVGCCAMHSLLCMHGVRIWVPQSEQWALLGNMGNVSVPVLCKCSFLPVYPNSSSRDRSTFWYQVLFGDPDSCYVLSSGN